MRRAHRLCLAARVPRRPAEHGSFRNLNPRNDEPVSCHPNRSVGSEGFLLPNLCRLPARSVKRLARTVTDAQRRGELRVLPVQI